MENIVGDDGPDCEFDASEFQSAQEKSICGESICESSSFINDLITEFDEFGPNKVWKEAQAKKTKKSVVRDVERFTLGSCTQLDQSRPVMLKKAST